MKIWKITNNTKKDIKIGIALSSNAAPGIILKPGSFCLSLGKMTSSLDMQHKRNYVVIEMDYINSLGLELGKEYTSEMIKQIKEGVSSYKSSV